MASEVIADEPVYEVDRKNFEALYPQISSAIKEATFFGLDLEFTALCVDERYRGTLFDTMEERYQKLRRALEGTAIHQFGLALFTKSKNHFYDVKCFNFYICPRPCPGTDHDPEVAFQASSVLFNNHNDPQFGRSFVDGISYMDRRTASRLRAELPSGGRGDLDRAVGFAKVFEDLVASRKVVVGHNCFTDLLLMHAAFVGPLPESYAECKRRLHAMFGTVFDTKHVVYELKNGLRLDAEVAKVLDNTGLAEVHDGLLKFAAGRIHVPRIGTIPSFEGPGASKAHEAGYDAYMAASVFLLCASVYDDARRSTMTTGGAAAASTASGYRMEPLSYGESVHALRAFENRANLIRGPCRAVSLSPDDGFKDLPSDRPPFLHVKFLKPSQEGLGVHGLSQFISKTCSGDVDCHELLCGGDDVTWACALVAQSGWGYRTEKNVRKRYDRVRELLTSGGNGKFYEAQTYSPIRHDSVYRNLTLVFLSFCVFSGVVAKWPLRCPVP